MAPLIPRRTFVAALLALSRSRLWAGETKEITYQPGFLHPNDRWVVVRGDKEHLFEILDLETGKSLKTLAGSECDTYQGAPQLFFEPSGRFLLMLYDGKHNYFLRIWDLEGASKVVSIEEDLLARIRAANIESGAGQSGDWGIPPFALPEPGRLLRFSGSDVELGSLRVVRRRKSPFQGPFLGAFPRAMEVRCQSGHLWGIGGEQTPFRTLNSSLSPALDRRFGLLPMLWRPSEASSGGGEFLAMPRRTTHTLLVWSGYSTVREIQCSTGKVMRCVSASMPQTGLVAFGRSRFEVFAARPLDTAVRWNRLAQPRRIKHPYLEEIEKPPLEELGTPVKSKNEITFDQGTRAIACRGPRLAIGRDDGSVSLGDAAARRGGPWEVLGKHDGAVRAMAFSSNQPWLLTGARDGSLVLWDAIAKSLLRVLPGHEARINSMTLGPQNLAATAGPDGIRISDLVTGKHLRHIETGGIWVSDVHFNLDGSLLVASLLDGTLGVWETQAGRCRWRVDAGEGWCATAAFHPDGHLVASGYELGAVVLWDAAKGMRVKKTRTDGKTAWQSGCRSVHALAWSPAGDALAVGFGDAVRVYDPELASGRGPGWILPLDWADYYT